MMRQKGQAKESQGARHAVRNNYNQLILSKIEHSLNIIIPAAIPLVLLMVVNDTLHSNIFILFVDISIAVSLIVLALLKNEISNTLKIILIALLTIIAGFTSIFESGYAGAGLLTLLVGCMLVAGFMSRRTSIVYALLLSAGVAVFIVLIQFNVITYDIDNPRFNPNLVPGWINLLIVFAISLLILIVIINVIKKYLGMSLSETEDQLETINQFAFYDTLTGLPNKNKFLSDNKKPQGEGRADRAVQHRRLHADQFHLWPGSDERNHHCNRRTDGIQKRAVSAICQNRRQRVCLCLEKGA